MTLHLNSLSKITTAQMQRILVLATGKYDLEARLLIEHAGRNVAALAQELVPEGPVLVVAGRGHNGGCGFSAARHLAARGRRVWVVPTHEPENYSGAPKEQLELLRFYDRVKVRNSLLKMKYAVAIDAAIGDKLDGPPRGRTLDVVTVLNGLRCPVIALDVPTGMMADDGSIPGEIISATATLALALPRTGVKPGPHVGDLYLADIGIPPQLYKDLGLEAVYLPDWITKLEPGDDNTS
jgi:NAD(P)H-hydrate epimerase